MHKKIMYIFASESRTINALLQLRFSKQTVTRLQQYHGKSKIIQRLFTDHYFKIVGRAQQNVWL